MNTAERLKGIGLEVKEHEGAVVEDRGERKLPTSEVQRSSYDLAVSLGLIPKEQVCYNFTLEEVVKGIQEQCSKAGRKFVVKQFDRYTEALNVIAANIIAKRRLPQSYLIGAPIGFGKTKFTNYCIGMLYQQGKVCTPYISLSELSALRIAENRRILDGIDSQQYYRKKRASIYTMEEYSRYLVEGINDVGYEKEPIEIVGKYSWSEYMNCEVLFCYFTDIASKILESETLKTALMIRSAKGLPTVAMISISVMPYLSDKYLHEYVWGEILEHTDEKSLGRVKHISCWKDYNITKRGV